MQTSTRIPSNPIVDRLRADGVKHLHKISGYIAVGVNGRIEIYSDLSMQLCIEIDEPDIIHVVDAAQPTDPSIVFVRKDAQVALRYTVPAAMLAISGPTECRCGIGASTAARPAGGGTNTEADCFGKFARCKIKCWLDYQDDPLMKKACEDSCEAAHRLCRSVGGTGGVVFF